MFDYVSGKIAAVEENKVVVDCGGVGFLLTASATACGKYAQMQEAKVPVYMAVRDDAIELFGFASNDERRLFVQLIGVSGVGPKLAIAVLGGFPSERIAGAIASGDTALISSIKGVGKKTAERIVLELKGKVDISGAVADGIDLAALSPVALDDKAVKALIGLGFDKREAETAVKRVYKDGMTTEDVIRAVLSSIG